MVAIDAVLDPGVLVRPPCFAVAALPCLLHGARLKGVAGKLPVNEDAARLEVGHHSAVFVHLSGLHGRLDVTWKASARCESQPCSVDFSPADQPRSRLHGNCRTPAAVPRYGRRKRYALCI